MKRSLWKIHHQMKDKSVKVSKRSRRRIWHFTTLTERKYRCHSCSTPVTKCRSESNERQASLRRTLGGNPLPAAIKALNVKCSESPITLMSNQLEPRATTCGSPCGWKAIHKDCFRDWSSKNARNVLRQNAACRQCRSEFWI